MKAITENLKDAEKQASLSKSAEESLVFKKTDFLRGKGLAARKPNAFRPIVFRGTQHRG